YIDVITMYVNVVVGEYLKSSSQELKVEVTHTEASKGLEFEDITTLMDLREAEKKDWKYAVFHRYGMMLEGDTMEVIAESDPEEIRTIFKKKFDGEHTWTYKKDLPGEYVIRSEERRVGKEGRARS